MALPSGTRLGPYEIVELRGKGGMGEVYRDRDTRLGRDVAVKVLPAELTGDDNYRRRLEREAKTISQLQHPNVCTLHDIGSEGATQYLVMEYLEGETLEDRLRRPLPVEDVLRIGTEIAEAVDAAHRKGVVHRDLKPGNVMLTEAGVKVLDFGLAREIVSPDDIVNSQAATVPAITGEGTLVGTMPYMAPEQLQGSQADARTDIWALGCILYEMVAGERPFGGKSQADLITAIMGAVPEPPSRKRPLAPEQLDHLVKRCLEKDPELRWQSGRDLSIELKALSEPSSSASSRKADVAGSNRRRWVVGAAFAVVLGVVGIWLFLSRESARQGAGSVVANLKYGVAVLPFDSFSAERGMDQVGAAIANEVLIRTARDWHVVPGSTSFGYQGHNACEAASEMNSRLVLEGSVSGSRSDLSVSAHLVECPGEIQVWAESFELDASGASFQGEFAQRLYGEMEPFLSPSISSDPESHLFLIASHTRENNAKARSLFRELAEMGAPGAGGSWNLRLVQADVQALREGWTESPSDLLAEIEWAIQAGIARSVGQDYGLHGTAAGAYMVLGQRENMLAACERLVEATGGLPFAHARMGLALALAGRPDEAFEAIDKALRLDGGDDYQAARWMNWMAMSHFAAARHQDAADWAGRSVEARPRDPTYMANAYQMLAVSLAQLGEVDRAREALAAAMEIRPNLSAEWVEIFYSTAEPEHRQRYLDGLRMAGLGGEKRCRRRRRPHRSCVGPAETRSSALRQLHR